MVKSEDPINKVFNINSGNSKIPWTLGRINDSPVELRIGIDTGADVSLISSSQVNRLKLMKTDSYKPFKLADNTICTPSGLYKEVVLNISGYECTLDLYDIGENEFDILLGVNGLIKLQVGVYPYFNLLRFPSGDVKLENSDYHNHVSSK